MIRTTESNGLVGPVDVATGGRTVWVYSWADQTARALDARTNGIVQVAAIGGFPPATGNAIAADADGAWVLSRKNGSGVLTRAARGIDFSRDYRLGYDPLAVAVGAGAVWVAAKSATAEVVLEIDPRTGKILRTVELGGADIASIAVGNGAVWVLQGDRISRLDPGTGQITRRATLPAFRVAQVAVGEGAVWITMQLSNGGNALVRLDPKTLRKPRTIMMPRGHNSATLTRVAVGRGAVWWDGADDGTVWRVDPNSGDITDAIRVTQGLRATADILPLALTADADAVWVTVSYGP